MKATSVKTIDEYLAALPVKVRATLQNLRKIIKSVAPQAEEGISYQIPIFKYHYMLVGFAAFSDHCSFFVMSTAIMNEFKEELKQFSKATATIHFMVDKPLPVALVKRIVRARMEENEIRLSVRELKKIKSNKSRK